MPMAHQDAGPG